MAESSVELQVVVACCGLLAVDRTVERCRIGEESISINAAVRSLAFVTSVVTESSTQVRMPTTFLLVITNQSPVAVFLVETLYGRIERFLIPTLFFGVELTLTVEHIDIAFAHDIR